MLENTLILVGPGGVGKGPLAQLIRDDAVTLDPYRLRWKGPRRDSDDPLYAHPKLRTELHSVLKALGDSLRRIPCEPEQMEWFAKAKVLFFTVRDEWQCLILHDLDGEVAKAELYAPILPAILGIPDISQAIGNTHVVVLNPSPERLTNMPDWSDLKSRTRDNCKQRGDSDNSVAKRVGTIPTEAPAWRTLVKEQGALEFTDWPFPEYRFKKEDSRQLLRKARRKILGHHPELEIFFKKEDEI
ncbi:MAG: hypothetical protein MUO27_04935 [Sedimentisphaerales bacterium]|nr:hypothetical protein [Sedimentisphaerales bacterium]